MTLLALTRLTSEMKSPRKQTKTEKEPWLPLGASRFPASACLTPYPGLPAILPGQAGEEAGAPSLSLTQDLTLTDLGKRVLGTEPHTLDWGTLSEGSSPQGR